VKQLIEQDGVDSFKIIRIKCRVDAREYEARLLKRLLRKYGFVQFTEMLLNRNVAKGILLTAVDVQQICEKRKPALSKAARRLYDEGRHNFQTSPANDLPHVRQLRSRKMQGNTYGTLRNITDEYRQQQALGSMGNTNVRGKKWWTNGTINKRSLEQPGIDFYLGTTKYKKD
jgi:hypothetical protein